MQKKQDEQEFSQTCINISECGSFRTAVISRSATIRAWESWAQSDPSTPETAVAADEQQTIQAAPFKAAPVAAEPVKTEPVEACVPLMQKATPPRVKAPPPTAVAAKGQACRIINGAPPREAKPRDFILDALPTMHCENDSEGGCGMFPRPPGRSRRGLCAWCDDPAHIHCDRAGCGRGACRRHWVCCPKCAAEFCSAPCYYGHQCEPVQVTQMLEVPAFECIATASVLSSLPDLGPSKHDEPGFLSITVVCTQWGHLSYSPWDLVEKLN